MSETTDVPAAVDAVRTQIADAARHAGRSTSAITLVAVSKTQPVEAVLAAYEAGVRDFGENTAQELTAKATALEARGLTVRWHFIGKLQRNKVNQVLRHAAVVHTLDRDSLAQALSERAPTAGIDVLVQVNIGREPQKGGVDPEETIGFAQYVAHQPRLRLVGLMAIPPADAPPEPHFDALAALSETLRRTPEGARAGALSMGMSHDFAAAIRCGATMVRVGTAIFGARRRRGENT